MLFVLYTCRLLMQGFDGNASTAEHRLPSMTFSSTASRPPVFIHHTVLFLQLREINTNLIGQIKPKIVFSMGLLK